MPPMVAREAVETVDRKPQAVRLELPVEVIEHNAGLDHAAARGNISSNSRLRYFEQSTDQRGIDRLPGLRGAAAARRHAHALVPAQSLSPDWRSLSCAAPRRRAA